MKRKSILMKVASLALLLSPALIVARGSAWVFIGEPNLPKKFQ